MPYRAREKLGQAGHHRDQFKSVEVILYICKITYAEEKCSASKIKMYQMAF